MRGACELRAQQFGAVHYLSDLVPEDGFASFALDAAGFAAASCFWPLFFSLLVAVRLCFSSPVAEPPVPSPAFASVVFASDLLSPLPSPPASPPLLSAVAGSAFRCAFLP